MTREEKIVISVIWIVFSGVIFIPFVTMLWVILPRLLGGN